MHQTETAHGKPKHLSITFDKNDMVPFSRLKTYLTMECKRIDAGLAFHGRRPMKTQVMNSGAMKAESDDECVGLQLADLIAGAFHDATENSRYPNKHNNRPAELLRRVMWMGVSPNKTAANNGVTLFPPYVGSSLTPAEKLIFEHYGYFLGVPS
jgi:hypothetical protein